jgi:hypothetical protein
MKNTLLSLMATAALTVSSVAAAETVCDKCAYPHPYVGYLGAYWPGDRGTFNHLNMVSHFVPYGPYGNGTFTQFDNYWVFDLNDNAAVDLTALERYLTNWGAELYTDAGSVCYAVVCPTLALGEVIGSHVDVDRRWTIKVPALVPGRYIIRIVGGTTTRGSYTGSITVR